MGHHLVPLPCNTNTAILAHKHHTLLHTIRDDKGASISLNTSLPSLTRAKSLCFKRQVALQVSLNQRRTGTATIFSHPFTIRAQCKPGTFGRRLILTGSVSLAFLAGSRVQRGSDGEAFGEEKGEGKGEEERDSSLIEGIRDLFDPNEKTKAGKLLPKGYLKSARDVVKSLRESLKEESAEDNKIRKSADSAKEAIRNYIRDWRGEKLVASEDSYKALEKAFRVLGEFYSKKGPRAVLSPDVKARVLEDLNVADGAL